MKEDVTAGQAAANLRSMDVYDWPHLTRAVLGRNGTRPEVVEELADMLTHEQPDSWERLRADIDKRDTCGYAGAGVDPELGVHDCERCRFHRDDLTCEMEMALDIFERTRALAGVAE